MTLIYEVTAVVEQDLWTRYETFMQERHIPDLMSTGAFASASFDRSLPGRYRIRYEAKGRGDLDLYLAEHAPRLRRDLIEHFPDGIALSREEWTVLERFA